VRERGLDPLAESAHHPIMARTFTVEQATNTLPLVRRIVEDLVVTVGRWQERIGEYEIASASVTPEASDGRAAELEREAEQLAREVDGFVAELGSLGIEVKDYAQGLIDFPAEREGRPVYLCWRLGEPAVQFWHEVDAGFAGRRPLDPLIAA
jgi:hypothetical protein